MNKVRLEDIVILVRTENGWDTSPLLEFEVKKALEIVDDLKNHKQTCLTAFCYCQGFNISTEK